MTFEIDKIEDSSVKKWYYERIGASLFEELTKKEKEKGYILDKKSGLFLRYILPLDYQKNLGHTIIFIKFPRPTDFHLHHDVDECLIVWDGYGELYTQINDSKTEQSIMPGDKIMIPRLTPHAFRPDEGGPLEIMVVCSGILDPEKEECKKRFYEFEPWLNYYDRIDRGIYINGLCNGKKRNGKRNGKNNHFPLPPPPR